MNYMFNSGLFAVALMLAMLLMLEVGRRIALHRIAQDPEGARQGVGALEGAVFGLMGLLVAFTFSGAATRFDARRQLMVQEANDIGTAYLRVDLLPADAQPALREKFRRYVDARIETYQLLPNLAAAEAAQARALQTQSEIWSQAVAATRDATSPQPTMLLLPALNQMIDISTTQIMAGRMHPPSVVFIMLSLVALACSLLAGYDLPGGKRRSWIHTLAFAGIMGIAVYVILDLEYPRLGLIRIDEFDRVLVEVRQSMK